MVVGVPLKGISSLVDDGNAYLGTLEYPGD